MKRDDKCEMRQVTRTPWGVQMGSCQCGSRACPLCPGCRSDLHLNHMRVDSGTGKTCQCDLCGDEATP